MITKESIEGLKNHVDIVDVASRYVELKKGGSSFKGLSPFNVEKTPSFFVHPQKNMWHDFSSGQGGDVFKLVMLLENIEFKDAVEKLAEEYNYTLSYDSNHKRVDNRALEAYLSWMRDMLYMNTDAFNYIASRGVSEDTIDKFEIGFAPDSAKTIEFLKKNFISFDDAISLGIIENGERGVYAKFTNRIMFPIRNAAGKLVGFSGRTISNHPAKYLNTKDTQLFHKSKEIFGIHLAKKTIEKHGFFILSEGQMDVVMQHQYGFKNSIATMGTAFTPYHARLLKRFASEAIIAYDGDRAGIAAAFKASVEMIKHGIDAKVVVFDSNEDPADILLNRGRNGYTKSIANGTPAINFCVEHILSKYDIANPFQKENAAREILSFSKQFSSIMQQEIIGTSEKILNVSIGKAASSTGRSTNKASLFKNMSELSILKAAVLSDDREIVSEIAEMKKCMHHKDIIDDIVSGEVTSKITEMMLDQSIIPSVNIRLDIAIFKKWCIDRYIHAVSQSKASAVEKMKKIREAKVKKFEIEQQIRSYV